MDKNSLVKVVPFRNDAILAYRVFDGQTALMDLLRGTLNTLNTTATRVWQLIGERMVVGKIAEKMCQEFGMPLDKITDDILEVLQEMASRGWINNFPSKNGGHKIAVGEGTKIFEQLREQAVQKQIPLVVHFDLTY